MYRFRDALEAAEYAISRAEASLDDRIGRRTRITLGRCAGAAFLGAPIAWLVAGMQWNPAAFGGLGAGVALFAVIDATRSSGGSGNDRGSGEKRKP